MSLRFFKQSSVSGLQCAGISMVPDFEVDEVDDKLGDGDGAFRELKGVLQERPLNESEDVFTDEDTS